LEKVQKNTMKHDSGEQGTEKKYKVQSEGWFDMAVNGERATHVAADPLNMRIPAPRVEVRKYFFTQRVPEAWNRILAALKSAAMVTSFCQGCCEY